MGKKDDWCSSKGLKNHKKGMYKKESKGRKICISATFCCSAIVYLVIAGVSLERATNAGLINSDFSDTWLDDFGETNAYDTCAVPDYVIDVEDLDDYYEWL